MNTPLGSISPKFIKTRIKLAESWNLVRCFQQQEKKRKKKVKKKIPIHNRWEAPKIHNVGFYPKYLHFIIEKQKYDRWNATFRPYEVNSSINIFFCCIALTIYYVILVISLQIINFHEPKLIILELTLTKNTHTFSEIFNFHTEETVESLVTFSDLWYWWLSQVKNFHKSEVIQGFSEDDVKVTFIQNFMKFQTRALVNFKKIYEAFHFSVNITSFHPEASYWKDSALLWSNFYLWLIKTVNTKKNVQGSYLPCF